MQRLARTVDERSDGGISLSSCSGAVNEREFEGVLPARESDGRCGAYVSNVADEVSSGGGEGYHSELSGEERADTYFVQERGRG